MPLLENLLGPRRAFEGGLFLPDHKSHIARRPIRTIRPEAPLHVPLRIQPGHQTEPVVAPGDLVVAGQRLAHGVGPTSLPIHAPVSGTILELGRTWSPLDGFVPCVVLEPDGRDAAVPQHQGWEDESFIAQLAEKGVMCPEPRAPLHVVVQEAVAAGVTDLIVNAMETEPYLTADLRTLVEQPGRIIDATCELADALGVSRAIIAMPFRHRRIARRMTAEAEGRHLEIAALANPYPQCHPIILLKAVLGHELSPGGNVLDEGAVVLPLAAVRCAAEALLDDRPMTHALMTISGDAVESPGTYRVPIGTTVGTLVEYVGLDAPVAKAVWGGSLTGRALGHESAVVTAESSGLLLFAADPRPEPVACIHCGWCVEDCPVSIDPPSLMHLESKSECDRTETLHLDACIDCGLCTHVCPSQLPLAETIRRTRTRIREFDGSRGAA